MGKRCKGKGALLVIILLGIFIPAFLASCNGGGSGGSSTPLTVADFSASQTTGNAPLTVAFTDNSTGAPTSWSWDFGDGGTSALQNPSHAYATAGTFTVSLTADGPGGMDNVTKVDYITVNPAAQFSASPTTGPEPLTVSFTDQSTGGPTSWSWDFGDGETSVLQNPSHDYPTGGSYTVSLTATGPGGSVTETKTGYINVTPLADFSGTPTTGDAPLTVAFTNLSSGSATSFFWNFGDDNTSTLQNPSNTYDNVLGGTYTVSLTATGPGGSNTNTKPAYITVGPLPPAPVAGFSGTPITGAASLTVDFTDESTGTISSWSWDFGDGGTSTLQNPSHDYAASGIYTVALTATGPGGPDTFTETDYITVTPLAEFSGTPTTGTAPLTVDFTDLSTGGATSWSWDFGDGGTSTAQSPTHVYDNVSGGNYTVSLTATGPGGSNTNTKPNYISTSAVPPPVAGFSGTPVTGPIPLTVDFTDESTGTISSWLWEFGDGGTSTLQNPSHDYVTSGTYTVALTATGPGGSDGQTIVNYITANPSVFTDNFDRADENPLGSSNGDWATAPGCSALQIVGTDVQATVTGVFNCAYWNADPFNNDQYSEVIGAYINRGPAVRIQTGGAQQNFYYAKVESDDGGGNFTMSIRKNVNGTSTIIPPTFTVTNLLPTTVIRLEAVGTTLQVFIDGAPQGSVTDTEFSSGAPGMWIFFTNITLDNWEGGSL
jgi:PKD repeat protein